MSFIKYQIKIDRQIDEGKPPGVWVRYSKFELPEWVLDYKGLPAAHILLHLFRRARGKSKGSTTEHDMSFAVSEDRLAQSLGLTTRSMQRAFALLEADNRIIRSKKKRCPTTGRFLTKRNSIGRFLSASVTLLNNQTGQPLQTKPAKWRVCLHNGVRPFITVPKACLVEIDGMKLPSQKATYIAALTLVSRDKQESVFTQRDKWRELTGLKKSAFNSGVAYLKAKKLLSYSGETLTVFDPKTGKPNERWKHPREWVDHVDTKWKDDLNDVPAERWQQLIETMLGRKFDVGTDGWSIRSECPFCREHKQRFRMNFQQSQFKCDCGQKGRLGQLITRLKKIEMSEVIALLKQSMKPVEVEV